MNRLRGFTETRLRAGAVVMKTISADAKHGTFWTFLDTGRTASGKACDRLERSGALVSLDALIPGESGQTYIFAPERTENPA
jgi:hypothetical protein